MPDHRCCNLGMFAYLLMNILGTSAALSRVAVIGSTGKLGRNVIKELLSRKIPCKCLVRSSSPPDFLLEHQTANPNLIEFVTNGDVTSPESLQVLLKDCSHCLALHGPTRRSSFLELLTAAEGFEDSDATHSKQINYESMKTLVRIANDVGCQKIVRITGLGETPWSFFSVLINGLGRMAKGWNYEGEQVLRQEASLDYTIIRPGIMKEDYDPTESKTHLELADNGEKLPVSPVSYRQIAMLCIDALEQPQTKRTTLTAMNVQNAGNEDDKLTIKQRLERVKSDSRDFPKSLVDEHKRAVKTVFRSLFAIVGLTLGILFRLVLA